MKWTIALIWLVLFTANYVNAQPFAYITNGNDNNVSLIDCATNTVIEVIPVGALPFRIAVAPNGNFVYVGNFDDNTISAIDTLTNNVIGTIPVGD